MGKQIHQFNLGLCPPMVGVLGSRSCVCIRYILTSFFSEKRFVIQRSTILFEECFSHTVCPHVGYPYVLSELECALQLLDFILSQPAELGNTVFVCSLFCLCGINNCAPDFAHPAILSKLCFDPTISNSCATDSNVFELLLVSSSFRSLRRPLLSFF